MRAVKFLGRNRVAVVDVSRPQAVGSIVVVKVTAAGICGTDLELLLPQEQPVEKIPGHEVVGVVAEVDEAHGFKPGDRVMVNCHVTCGHCEHCRNGDVIFCPELKAIGFELDGGDAEYVAVPAASLRALPDDISDALGVIAGDALGTPYHAAKRASIVPGEMVGVFGVGPLGQMAVLSAHAKGARVVAVDRDRQRLERARRFGAEVLIDTTTTEPVQRIRELTAGRGLDKALECAGSSATIQMALNALKLRGRLVQVGVCPHAQIDTFDHIIKKEVEILGSRNFNNFELDEIIDVIRRYPAIGSLASHEFPLERAAEAFDMAMKRAGDKILLRP